MSDRPECAMGFCYRKPDPGSLFCERHKETECLRARIAELTGALEAAKRGLRGMAGEHGNRGGVDWCAGLCQHPDCKAHRILEDMDRAALARPSTGGGARPPAERWRRFKDTGRLDPVTVEACAKAVDEDGYAAAAMLIRALSQGTAAARLSPFEHDTTDGSGE